MPIAPSVRSQVAGHFACARRAGGADVGGLSLPSLGSLLLVGGVAVAAIANIAPTPGGIGPLEAATIAALSGFGLDAPIAISSVLTFRLATFWLPIAPGWATFVWMERRGEI